MLEVVIWVRPKTGWLTDIESKYDTAVSIHDRTLFGKEDGQGLIEMDAAAYIMSEIIRDAHGA